MKACTKCRIVKPAREFHRSRREADGRQDKCKVCQRAAVRECRGGGGEMDSLAAAGLDHLKVTLRNAVERRFLRRQ